ncbi:MAG: hypothetical protein PHY25_04155 [Dehalococcoidales bacterium]|nr:hypothetical protein [Dehalococcoidales bacterium]MDD4230803.1 hypothetical protein [Dehalococcoidales bacterium]MDD4465851.1 hypothetical protein [Dehalococcoidales bacterium]MDX9803310.1 hypothetical protein [Dehalococcoidales bacterium]
MNIITTKVRNSRKYTSKRTTIGLKTTTKERIDRFRAPGQCYDGFIRQLVDCWERNNSRLQ